AQMNLDVVGDAEGAWGMLRMKQYDLAIIDHFLPLQSGAELIAKMRSSLEHRAISIVAISIGGSDARERSMSAGADLFLDKPIVLRDLFSTLDRLTGAQNR